MSERLAPKDKPTRERERERERERTLFTTIRIHLGGIANAHGVNTRGLSNGVLTGANVGEHDFLQMGTVLYDDHPPRISSHPLRDLQRSRVGRYHPEELDAPAPPQRRLVRGRAVGTETLDAGGVPWHERLPASASSSWHRGVHRQDLGGARIVLHNVHHPVRAAAATGAKLTVARDVEERRQAGRQEGRKEGRRPAS